MRPYLLAAVAAVALLPVTSAIAQDRVAANRIIDEGMNHSQVMQTAQHLTDVIGPRMTNSPAMRTAEGWTAEQFAKWGLKNVHKEGFPFGRGWSIERASVRMVSPRPLQLTAIPIAWTPATNGASGPTTTKSADSASASATTRSASVGSTSTTRPSAAIPAFPGAPITSTPSS